MFRTTRAFKVTRILALVSGEVMRPLWHVLAPEHCNALQSI